MSFSICCTYIVYSRKFSKRGNTNTTIKNFVDVKDLNPLQKAYAAFAKEMDVPIIFFRGNKNFHGAHANGISYYNVDATFSPEFVYWHEFGHWLKNNQPQLFKEMLDAADITKAQLDEKRNSRPELTDDELKEEIICDAMSDVARRTGLLSQIGKKNSSLIQRIISWAKTTLDRFTDWFNRKELGLTNAQRDRMKDVFGKGVRQITDSNGNKIFRYNNRTHEIELVDGRKLPTVQNSAKPKYSLDAETKKSTVTVTGDEFGEYTDLKDLRKKAKDFYKNVLRGTSVRNPILGEVELTDDIVMFTNIGLNKMGSTSAQYEKLLLVKHLPELIESADRVSAEENYKNKRNASQYSYLHSTALVNGKVRDVNITRPIRKHKDMLQFYW